MINILAAARAAEKAAADMNAKATGLGAPPAPESKVDALLKGSAGTGQTIAQLLNRTHGSAMVKATKMDKDAKVRKIFSTAFAYLPFTLIMQSVLRLQDEALDIIIVACEGSPWSNEAICQTVKSRLDDKFGASWQVAVGETYSFDVSYDADFLIYVYYGSLAILAWKCGSVLKNEMKYKAVKS